MRFSARPAQRYHFIGLKISTYYLNLSMVLNNKSTSMGFEM